MKRIIIMLITIVLMSKQGYSQTVNHIGINFTPSITIPNLHSDVLTLDGKISYSFGLNYLLSLNNDFLIRTGICYMEKRSVLKDIVDTRNALVDQNGNPIIDINDPGARIDPKRIYYMDQTDIYQSIIIPVNLDYKLFGYNDKSLMLSAGVESGYLFNIKSKLGPEAGSETVWDTKMNNWLTSINVGLSWYYPISDKLLLSFTPKYSYDFYPDKNTLGFNFQTFSLGIECYYKF